VAGTFVVVAPAALADVYVRHAMPLVDSGLPASEWDLGPGGRASARELAALLVIERPVAVVVSSTERKARSTAEPIAERFGVAVVEDDRLVEADRPWIGVPNDYRGMARRYLRGASLDGWEAQGEVVDRMSAAVRDARARAGPEGAVLAVGHGLSICLHLAAGLPRGFDAAGLWARLAFPDAWAVDRDDLVLSRCR
jgi:broad specificity phosphatase PhoE